MTFRLYHKINPIFIFEHNDYNRFRGKPFADDYDFKLNAKGFKDVTFGPKTENVVRLLAIGDSFTFGIVPYKYNYLTLLEEQLNTTNNRVEILNMGIPAIGPKNYVSVLIKEGLALQPDGVIVSFFIGNDFLESERPFSSYSYILTFLKYLWNIRAHYQGNVFHGKANYHDEQKSFSDEKFLEIEAARSRIYQKNTAQFEVLLNQALSQLKNIKKICDNNNIQLMIVIIPDEVQVNQQLQSEVITALKMKPEAFDFSIPNQRLSQALTMLNINHLDLYPAFLQASAEKRLYKPNDSHWNIAGNQLSASLIRHYLSSGKWHVER
ncbi:MAG: SGNH/GDSL hydrolase family protein [Thermodesulfobacteriota bacterium]|nr:SGNH/GDSL hydrolase family protein [Thermodesulfobacteriota bacterium]